jgi:hypothetical protein
MVARNLLPSPSPFARALDETGDVHELDDRGNGLLGLDDLGKAGEPGVGDLDHADVRLDGTERIVGRLGFGGGQRIEQRRLADVRQADDTKFQH